MKLTLHVNGKAAQLAVDDPQMPLLYALRDGLCLRGLHRRVSNAVWDAIGVRLRSVPFTPEKVLAALRG